MSESILNKLLSNLLSAKLISHIILLFPPEEPLHCEVSVIRG